MVIIGKIPQPIIYEFLMATLGTIYALIWFSYFLSSISNVVSRSNENRIQIGLHTESSNQNEITVIDQSNIFR